MLYHCLGPSQYPFLIKYLEALCALAAARPLRVDADQFGNFATVLQDWAAS